MTEAGRRAALRVVRSKGLIWLTKQDSHYQQGKASLAGRSFSITYHVPWSAATDASMVSRAEREATAASPLWQEPWGDRRTELVVIGQDMDHAAMMAALEACVVTDEEIRVGFRDPGRDTGSPAGRQQRPDIPDGLLGGFGRFLADVTWSAGAPHYTQYTAMGRLSTKTCAT